MNKEEFNTLFAKFAKNRDYLCNEKGQLKKEHKKYHENFQKLANEVGSMATAIVAEETGIYIAEVPESKKEIIDLWEAEKDTKFRNTLLTGTIDDFYALLKDFKSRCLDIAIKYYPV